MRFGLLVAALVLCVPNAHAALVATGSAAFGEPSGGVSSPIFGGTLHAEVFDAAGGTFSYTGEAVAATGGDYTVALQVVLNPDAEGEQALIDKLTLSAFMLGPGDFGTPPWSFGPAPGSGGTLGGGGDPSFAVGGGTLMDPGDAIYTWATPMAEGDTSVSLYFTYPNLVVPDSMSFALTTTVATSVNGVLPLLAPPPVVPEPTSLALVAGAAGLLALRRRR